MVVAYALNEKLIEKFRQPFGLLLRGTPLQTTKQLKGILVKEKPTGIITVGDRVSRNLLNHGIEVQLSIIDNKSMRKRLKPIVLGQKKWVKIENPQGTITEEAMGAVKNALQSQHRTHILVEGEEDLLTLPAVLYAPEDSLVVYGQPREGIVIVKVTPEKRTEAKNLLDAMACSGKPK